MIRKVLTTVTAALLLSATSVTAFAAASAGETTFTVKISSVTNQDALKLPGGTAINAPIAPGVFVVSSALHLIFQVGKAAGSNGLEALAEDGNFAPLQAALTKNYGNRAGMFVPGIQFQITAKPGERLAFATMFVQSNDKFYAPKDGSLALFDKEGRPISGEQTDAVRLYDAGTEIDEQPGLGPNQAPRQKTGNTGSSQHSVVSEAHDGFVYPAVSEVINIEVTPQN